MNTEERFTHARHQLLEESTPGSQALAEERASLEAVKTEAQTAEAQKSWQKVSDPAKVTWGRNDYNYVGAHCAGTNLELAELPNRYFTPNARNVAGHDLATGTPVKSVVFKDYEGNAAYGVGQLSRSRTTIGGVKPPEDVIGLAAVAASMQGSGASYEDFANGLPDWSDVQKQHSWAAGTEALRHGNIAKRLENGEFVSLHRPSSGNVDFDARMADPEFQRAGRTLYKHFWGNEFRDTDAAAARWLANHLRDLDWNTPMAAAIMLKGKNATWETHQAYITALEAWGKTNMEKRWLPQLGSLTRVIFDPMNLWGTPIGKLTVNSAARFTALDFFRRLGSTGAVSGATGAATQAVASANVQARDPTAGELVTAAAGGAVLGEALPLAFQAAGKAISRGVKALARPGLVPIPPQNVNPKPSSGIYGEISLPNREGDAPVRTGNDPMPATAGQDEAQAPVNLEQQPFEGPPGFTDDPQMAEAQRLMQGFQEAQLTEGQADEMLGGPPAAQVQGAEAAAAALPVETARPSLPRDPVSRVMIDPDTGYYSPVQKAVVDAKSARLQPAQWMAEIKRAQFLKQDELEWLDLDKFFKGKDSVTKEELLAHIDENLVKIQRYPLVAQRRNTISLEQHVADTNPEYARLRFEAESVENEIAELQHALYAEDATAKSIDSEIDEVLRKTADIPEDDPRYQSVLDHLNRLRASSALHRQRIAGLGDFAGQMRHITELKAHMARVAAEQRKLMLASGERPPGVHGLEHMLADPNNIEPREAVEDLLKALDRERASQDQLTRARSPGSVVLLNAQIAANQRIAQDSWKTLERLAEDYGAFILPQDLARVEGMVRYGNPEVRDYSIVGSGARGTRISSGGIDPIGHQIALYRHPEGLQAHGTGGHPGGETPGTLGWAITSERTLTDGSAGRLVDEGQADLVKERKEGEKQYREMKPAVDADPDLDFDGAAALRFSHDYDDYVWQIYRDSFRLNRPAEKRQYDKLPEHWADATPAQRDAMLRAKDLWGINPAHSEDVPALPKQIFYSTAMSNIFKSELYNAAVDGRDWFGWVTSDVVQARYGARPVTVQGEVLAEPYSSDRIRLVSSGGVRRTLDLTAAYELADRLGGDNGSTLRKLAHEIESNIQVGRDVVPASQGLYFDKETRLTPGAFWSYDVQIKKDMEKVVAKYGGKVEQKDMPIAPGATETVKVWVIKITPELRQKLLERGVPIGAQAGAAAALTGQEEETQ